MRISPALIFALLLDATIAGKPHGTRYEGPGGARKIPGYDDSGRRHGSAPAADREVRHQIDDLAERRRREQTASPYSAPVYPPGYKGPGPKPGDDAFVQSRNAYGGTHTTQKMGTKANDHLDARLDMERRQPEIRDAMYRKVPDSGRRSLITGGLRSNRDTSSSSGGQKRKASRSPPKGMHEEKPYNTQSQIPVNYRDVGVPGTMVYNANQKTSTNRDSPGGAKLGKLSSGPYDTSSVQANPPPGYKPGPVAPERAPPMPGLATPYHEIKRGDTFLQEAKPNPGQPLPKTARPSDKYKIVDSQWGAYNYNRQPRRSRSRSPRRSGHRRRSIYTLDALRKRDTTQYYDDDNDNNDNYNTIITIAKRDGLDEVNGDESQAAAPSKTDDYDRHTALLDIFAEAKSNATDIIMPILADMVDGQNSSMVWDAAWEIMTLADPHIIVTGPFHQGSSSLDWWETQIYNDTEAAVMNSMMATNDVLYDLYDRYWHTAFDALNSTGYVDMLEVIQEDLATNDTEAAGVAIDLSTHRSINSFFDGWETNELAEVEDCVKGNSTVGCFVSMQELGYGGNGTAAWNQTGAL